MTENWKFYFLAIFYKRFLLCDHAWNLVNGSNCQLQKNYGPGAYILCPFDPE